MAVNLEFEETSIEAQVKKEVTCIETLYEGSQVKAEIGENELNKAVPAGKKWDVVLNVRITETDV